MSSGSDTEAESQTSGEGWDPAEFVHISTVSALDTTQDIPLANLSVGDLQHEIDALCSIDLEAVAHVMHMQRRAIISADC